MASSLDWKAPAALPPWAEVHDKDDTNIKNVKNLVSAHYGLLCEMKSKYLAKKRYSEELERFVTDSKKEVEQLNNKIMQQDKEILQKDKEIIQKDEIILQQKALIDSLQQSVQQ